MSQKALLTGTFMHAMAGLFVAIELVAGIVIVILRAKNLEGLNYPKKSENYLARAHKRRVIAAACHHLRWQSSLSAMIKSLREKSQAPMLQCKKAIQTSQAEGATSDADILRDAMEILRKSGQLTAAKKSSRSAEEGLVGTLMSPDGKFAVIAEVNCETDFVSRNANFHALIKKILHTSLSVTSDAPADASISTIDVEALSIDGKSSTELVNDAITSIGENIVLKRAAALRAVSPESVIVSYVHSQMDHPEKKDLPLGRLAALVSLTSSSSSAPVDEEFMKDSAKRVAMHIVAANPLYMTRSDVPEEVVEKEAAILTELAKSKGKPENIIEKMVQGGLQKYYKENVLTEQVMLVGDQGDSVGKVLDKEGLKLESALRFQLGSN